MSEKPILVWCCEQRIDRFWGLQTCARVLHLLVASKPATGEEFKEDQDKLGVCCEHTTTVDLGLVCYMKKRLS